jgi:hypothetical protein
MARLRLLGLMTVTFVGGGSGDSALAAQTAMGNGDRDERSHNAAENSVQKLRSSKPQFLKLIRKSDLAAVGHGLELSACFP